MKSSWVRSEPIYQVFSPCLDASVADFNNSMTLFNFDLIQYRLDNAEYPLWSDSLKTDIVAAYGLAVVCRRYAGRTSKVGEDWRRIAERAVEFRGLRTEKNEHGHVGHRCKVRRTRIVAKHKNAHRVKSGELRKARMSSKVDTSLITDC